jgi:hypothetical protein
LLRVTKAFIDELKAEVSIETRENVSYINADELTRWPDFVAAGTWYADSKYLHHFRLAGLLRDLRAEGSDRLKDSALGWTISGSGTFVLPFLDKRDNLKLSAHYGDGYGAQLKSGPDDGVFKNLSSELKTIGVFASYGGLQHWWSDSFRSNLVYGYVNADNPGSVDGDELERTWYTAANLIWNHYKGVSLGFEYLWGGRENKDGADGTDHRFLFHTRFDY